MIRGLLKEGASIFDYLNRLADPLMVIVFTFIIGMWNDNSQSTAFLKILKIYTPILILIVFPFFNLYKSRRGESLRKEILIIFYAWLTVLIAFNIILLLLANHEQFKTLWPFVMFKVPLFQKWAISVFILICSFRIIIRLILRYLRAKGYNIRKSVIIGAGELGEKVSSIMSTNMWMGYHPIAFFDDDSAKQEREINNIKVKGKISDLSNFLIGNNINAVFIALPFRYENRIQEIISVLNEFDCEIKFVPDVFTYFLIKSSMSEIANLPVISMNKIKKRWVDIIIAFFMILLLSPFFLIVPLLIFILEGRPIFYVSKRLVKKNKEIKIYKFRSMVRDATSEKYQLKAKYMKDGYLDIPLTAEVYTKIGRILERTQLVEIPQLFNVLLGHMSIMGNRPLPKDNIELLKDKEGWFERFYSPAGLTGISQVVGKHNLTPDKRLFLERMYSRIYRAGNIILCDIYIIYRTFLLIVLRKSLAYEKACEVLSKFEA